MNNLCTTKDYQRFFKLFYVDCRGGLSPCNNDSESGRSLVEMLGVLAVMGILTIGGITGFNYAMNKQRANATVNYVNQLAVLGTGQMLAGNKPKLLDYPNHTPSGYPADITTEDGKDNLFYIEINEVPTAVCDEIISRLDGWKMVNDIGFFNGVGACADAEQVNMWFEISANANKGDTNYHCKTNNDCKNRLGNSFVCNAKGTCELSCPSGYVKTPVGCCATDKVFNGGCCRGTITEEDGVKKCCMTSWGSTVCCAAGEFIHNNECWPCDTPDDSFTQQSDSRCKVCPNRLNNGKWGCSTKCIDPDAIQVYGWCHCPPDRPVQSGGLKVDAAKCLACDDTRVGGWGNNIRLGYDTSASQTAHYCNRCNGGGYSYYCAPGTVGVSAGEKVTRLVDGAWTNFTGPDYGACVPCDELKIANLKYKAQCESCGGKWNGTNWYTGSCEPKG